MKALIRLTALTLAFTSVQAFAARGTLLWSDSVDPMLGDGSASHVVAAGSIAYAAGSGPFKGTPSSDADIRVRAYATAGGALLWEDVWDAGGMHQDDDVADTAVSGPRFYLAGSSGTNTADRQGYVVRAYDRRTGAVLWEDHCGQINSGAKAIAADAYRVFAAGTCSTAPGGAGIVRAYSAVTGRQQWEADDIALPLAIALSGDAVLVAGTDAAGALVLHAYGVKHGALLWEARPAEAQGLSLRSAELAADQNRAYLAWRAVDGSDQPTDQVAAYSVAKGRLRWQADPGDQVHGLALTADRLFAAQAGDQVLVSAYDAAKGTRIWQDQPGTATAPYSALGVTTGGKQVIIAGQAYDPATDSAPHFMVRAYSRAGKLLWEDETPTTTLQGAEAMSMAWSRNVAVASGMDSRSEPPFGTTHWLVRAYSTTGAHQSRLEPKPPL